MSMSVGFSAYHPSIKPPSKYVSETLINVSKKAGNLNRELHNLNVAKGHGENVETALNVANAKLNQLLARRIQD